jgi:hypothetical protein
MDYLTKTKTSVFKFQAVSVAKVNKFLRSLTACKSTGTDKIPAKIIRIAAPVIADPLTKIFNTAIFNETVPFEWKIAIVIPLHKKVYETYLIIIVLFPFYLLLVKFLKKIL